MSRETKMSAELLKFAQENSFGIFITHQWRRIGISHINLMVDEASADKVSFLGHLAKTNPHADELLKDPHATFVFTPPLHPLSKPTSALHLPPPYVALHVQGRITLIESDQEIRSMLDRLVQKYESEYPQPWTIPWNDKKVAVQSKGIVAFRFEMISYEVIHTSSIRTPSIDMKKEAEPKPDNLVSPELDVQEKFEMLPWYNPTYSKVTDLPKMYSFIHQYPNCILITPQNNQIHIEHLMATMDKSDIFLSKNPLEHPLPTSFKTTHYGIAIFRGPHCYISPSWYSTQHNVPTWNYTAVQIQGRLLSVDSDHDALSSKVFKLIPEKIEGKFKLNQNRCPADRMGVIKNLGRTAGVNPERSDIAELMKPLMLSSSESYREFSYSPCKHFYSQVRHQFRQYKHWLITLGILGAAAVYFYTRRGNP